MPSGVSAVATLSSGTSFSWNAATGASQYDLMSCNSGTKPWTKLATIAR